MQRFRILPVIIAVVVLVSSLAFPASATVLDYRDYIVDIVVEGDKDLVTLHIPASMASWDMCYADGTIDLTWTGASAVWHNGNVHNVCFYPLGKGNEFTMSDFPDGTEVTFSIFLRSQTTINYSATELYLVYPFKSAIGMLDVDGTGTSVVFDYTFTIDRSFADGNFFARADIYSVHSVYGGHVEYSTGTTTVTFSISSAYRDYIENGKNQELMDEIKDQLAEQNKTLEEILSGGSAGDDLIAGSDKLEDAGAGLGDNIGQVQDFENQYMGQLDSNMGAILGGGDLTLLVKPLSFVHGYVNKIVAGIPSKYMVIFTLPILFGFFFYFVQHPIKAPRPDTSGDQVTRETFTTTTVLSGKNAGSSTTTRTVTTSQEIGRVHKE